MLIPSIFGSAGPHSARVRLSLTSTTSTKLTRQFALTRSGVHTTYTVFDNGMNTYCSENGYNENRSKIGGLADFYWIIFPETTVETQRMLRSLLAQDVKLRFLHFPYYRKKVDIQNSAEIFQ